MIRSQFYLKIFSKEGVRIGEITGRSLGNNRKPLNPRKSTGFIDLICRDPINDAGSLLFTLEADHKLFTLPEFKPLMQVELWVNNGTTNKFLFRGLYIDYVTYDDNDLDFTTVICIGERGQLGFNDIMYPADTTNSTIFSNIPAENLMKHIVVTNYGHLATTVNGKLTNTPEAERVIEPTASLGRGKLFSSWACFGQNVLEALQKISEAQGGDFDLIKVGPRSWAFEWYQVLGTDRSIGNGAFVISKQRRNMFKPKLEVKRARQKSVVVGAGQGQEENRVFTPPQVDLNAPFYSEKLLDLKNQKTPESLLEATKGFYIENSEQRILTFETYEEDLNLGDLVLSEYRGEVFRQKVELRTFESDTQAEDSVSLTLRTR